MQCHGKNQDYVMLSIFQLAGGDNISQEDFEDYSQQYHENEAAFIAKFDDIRHKEIIQSVQQARSQRLASLAGVLGGAVGIAETIANDVSKTNAESKARAAAEAEASREKSRQYWSSIDAERQANIAANNQSSTSMAQNQTTSDNTKGSIRDLYTSDPTWNSMVDKLNQQHGPEKTRQIVQEMRAKQAEDRAQAEKESFKAQQSSAEKQAANVQEAAKVVNGNANTSETNKGDAISAITANRTHIYLLSDGGVILGYAMGKDSMGRFNWNYLKAQITDLKYTPYYEKFKNEYSKAAFINGVGYVFF